MFNSNKFINKMVFLIPVLVVVLAVFFFIQTDSVSAQTLTQPGKLDNPLGGITTIDGFIKEVINIILAIAWAAAAFFLLLSGFRFVEAQGNPEKLKIAKKTFLNTIIGITLIAGANVIVKVIQDTVSQLGS